MRGIDGNAERLRWRRCINRHLERHVTKAFRRVVAEAEKRRIDNRTAAQVLAMLTFAFGGIGGVVLCYGYMGKQAEVQSDPDATRHTIDINFTSAANLLEQFAAYFAEKKRGFIAVLSSVAGDGVIAADLRLGFASSTTNAGSPADITSVTDTISVTVRQ